MKVNAEERAEKAKSLFKEGYNCSQSVLLAYCDFLGLDKQLAANITAPLGGGMGRLREVCGAVSGMFMVAGLHYKAPIPNDKDAKTKIYKIVQELAESYRKENGSIICRDLLKLDHKSDNPVPEERTEGYYKRRPCAEYVGIAARIVGEKINSEE